MTTTMPAPKRSADRTVDAALQVQRWSTQVSVARADAALPSLAEYDELPYDCLPFPQTHPARLATLARLFGLTPPTVETCRVLEVGCANGNNLIPMAAALPRARFLGVDLSARQIAEGTELIAAAGLTNIELRHADLAALGDADGTFDYIVAHGVYSWVPPAVRDALLAICSRNLARNGVAYVSYNTLPGWSTNGMLRDMMLFRARGCDGGSQRMRVGRDLLDFLARALPDTPYGSLVREEVGFLRQQPDAYVSHDHMADCNDPVYFHQFAEHASRYRLKYLAEAEFSAMGLGGLAADTITTMRMLSPDLVAFEQLTDILRHRAFRQTLLVHDDVAVDRRLDARSIAPFTIASPVTLSPAASATFTARNGKSFNVGNPLTRAALLALVERWPESVGFGDLHETARSSLPATLSFAGTRGRSTPDMLAFEILQLYAAGIVDLRTWDPGVSATITERPAASPLARLQARRGREIATLLHQPLTLSALDRALVPLLDGTRDLTALCAALGTAGAARAPADGVTSTHDLGVALRAALQRLARAGVLTKARAARPSS